MHHGSMARLQPDKDTWKERKQVLQSARGEIVQGMTGVVRECYVQSCLKPDEVVEPDHIGAHIGTH